MHAFLNARRGLMLAATAALLAATACAAAATAPAGGNRNGAGTRTGATSPAGPTAPAGPIPGWRVIKRFGPDRNGVSGVLTAVSARDAWSTWAGTGFTVVERWTGSAWQRVSLPARFDPYVRSAIAIGASSASDSWVFGTRSTTRVLRWTGHEWLLQPIPSWVLRRASGTVTATAAVFGPGNLWVFSMSAGAYAAHYNGHTWAKVRMPETPIEASAAAPGDIWALGPDISGVMHWNGKNWGRIGLPALPLPFGSTVSYSNITAVGAEDAWVMRTITYKSGRRDTAMMHWNGRSWATMASPADLIGSLVPDGGGGLWADGIDMNPGGFWLLYHLAGGHWKTFDPPNGVDVHSPEVLSWIPGTRSVWATGSGFNSTVTENFGVILKYGP